MNLIFNFSGTLAIDAETPSQAMPRPGAQPVTNAGGDEVEWVEGLPPLLFSLARHHRLFLFSAREGALLKTALAKSGLESCFTAWQGLAGDKRLSLPAFLREHDLHPDETAYIGDAALDMEAALAAGVAGWGVTWGRGSAQEVAPKAALTCATVRDLEGEITRREWAASRIYPLATVGALILDEAESVLLVRTRKWSGLWGIPGGKVDYGESLERALRREVREETGLELGELRFVLLQDAVELPEFYRPRHFILTNFAGRAGGIRPDVTLNHEGVEWKWVALDEGEGLALNAPTRRLLETYRGRGGWPGLQGVHF